MSEYKKVYPDAKVIGVHSLAEKLDSVKMDGSTYTSSSRAYDVDKGLVYGADKEGTKYGYEDEVCFHFVVYTLTD